MIQYVSERVQQAVDLLRSGGLVGLPTETVYGLGADARNPAAVARIFAAKQCTRKTPSPMYWHARTAITKPHAAAPACASRIRRTATSAILITARLRAKNERFLRACRPLF